MAIQALPADDPFLRTGEYDLRGLAEHWAEAAARRPISAEAMRGADARAQRLGVSGERLMEQAGAAVAWAALALLRTTARLGAGSVLILAGPGNNGGDGFVAARYLASVGVRSVVVLVSSGDRPGTGDAAANWDRLEGIDAVDRMHAATGREVAVLVNGIERAALVVDALLGSGVRGRLRDPIRAAVDLARRARRMGVPVLAIDTPTGVDPTSGLPSDPVVRADATVTFHRPKEGLLTRSGRLLAGQVLVAPIGIPPAADPS